MESGFLLFTVFATLQLSEATATFNQNLFGVWSDPWIFQNEGLEYTEADLISMASVIASRFSKVILRDFDAFEGRLEHADIPVAIAKFNKFHRLKDQPPISIMITWRPSFGGSMAYQFELTWDVFTEANSIFNGTVTSILLRSDVADTPTNIKDSIKALKYLKRVLSRRGLQVGLYHGIGDPKPWGALLNHVDLVILTKWTRDYRQKNSASGHSVKEFTDEFQKLKTTIKKMNPTVDVGFVTDCTDSFPGRELNYTRLINFWTEFNQWAVTSGTKVFMFEAFDTFRGRLPSETHLGWWFAEGKTEGPNGTIKFVEKASRLFSHKHSVDQATVPVLYAVLVGLLILVLITAVMFWIHKRRLRNLKRELLTKEEIREFYEGGGGCGNEVQLAQCNTYSLLNRPYNASLELAINMFTIEPNSILGSGTFGIVLRGKVEEKPVAAKMAKAGCPSTALKGLLCEIKVLDHVGTHENVVELVGAYTAELASGKVIVFLELCSNGSLESYLRSMAVRGSSADVTSEGDIELFERPYVHPQHLNRWSFEIANGMEFLASKNVVHSDLATRNVLLTSNNTAKISDFGLSRKLYDYTNYVKTQQEPLPWRWMAPESLKRLQFNEKTDVWAYGITLWEIYSLGDIPYSGLSWNVEFAEQLGIVLKLARPRYASEGTYVTMLNCWEVAPSARPTFSELKNRCNPVYTIL